MFITLQFLQCMKDLIEGGRSRGAGDQTVNDRI